MAVGQGQKPLAVIVTAGQRSDRPQFTPVLGRMRVARLHGGRPHARPDRVLGGRTYGSRANRRYLRLHGIRCTIPEKKDQIANRKSKGRQETARTRSTRRSTSSGTPWNAGSIASSATGTSPPAMTSSPSAWRPPSTSPSSASGSGPWSPKHA
ncbi:transposase [Streptomyces carpinensis]|uniref:transposase n=1 Tax=Streptomyces carpinensis TaxID=66369 RepID=UPI001FC94610|nr:transposase [Streptomyces carpinensis]